MVLFLYHTGCQERAFIGLTRLHVVVKGLEVVQDLITIYNLLHQVPRLACAFNSSQQKYELRLLALRRTYHAFHQLRESTVLLSTLGQYVENGRMSLTSADPIWQSVLRNSCPIAHRMVGTARDRW